MKISREQALELFLFGITFLIAVAVLVVISAGHDGSPSKDDGGVMFIPMGPNGELVPFFY